MDACEAICVLLSDASARAAFARDREAWILANAVEDPAQTVRHLNEKELEVQAQVLTDKRLGEISDFVPRALTALGERAREVFTAYVNEAPWPTGNHLRHINDAIAFLRWLEQNEPSAVSGVELTDCLAARRFRRDGARLTAQLSGHADVGPLLTWVVVVTTLGDRWSLLFPLPYPAALWRRRQQRALGTKRVSLLRA